jgi:hypothetical protein
MYQIVVFKMIISHSINSNGRGRSQVHESTIPRHVPFWLLGVVGADLRPDRYVQPDTCSCQINHLA